MRGKGWTSKAAVTVTSLVVCAVAIGLGYFMGNYAMTTISTGRRVPPPEPVVQPAKPTAPQAPSAQPSQAPASEPTPSSDSQLLTDLDDSEPTTAQSASPSAGPASSAPASATAPLFKVQVGPFSSRQEAVALSGQLLADGYHTYITAERPYRVQVGAFSRREMADRLVAELKGKAYANVRVVAAVAE